MDIGILSFAGGRVHRKMKIIILGVVSILRMYTFIGTLSISRKRTASIVCAMTYTKLALARYLRDGTFKRGSGSIVRLV